MSFQWYLQKTLLFTKVKELSKVVHTIPEMQRAALYIACSRTTSAAGLYIIGPKRAPRIAFR